MIEYLYLLKHIDDKSFKVGITNNLKKRIQKIEIDFGKINYHESLIFSCPNRALIENIEHGTHAFLNNNSFSPKNLVGGSTEWFEIQSFNKCLSFLKLYEAELDKFVFEGKLEKIIINTPDFDRELNEVHEDMYFLKQHSKVVEAITEFISYHKDTLTFSRRDGFFVISNVNLDGLEINELPLFQWVRKDNNKLLFDIAVYNKWKQQKINNSTRGLVEVHFFNEFKWNNYKKSF